jgi:hypothetical protein
MRDDCATAISRAERSITLGAQGSLIGSLRLLQAEAGNWCGRHVDSEGWAREAIGLCQPGAPEWAHGIHQLVWSLAARNVTKELAELSKVLGAAIPKNPSHLHALACGQISGWLGTRGLVSEARDLLASYERSGGAMTSGIIEALSGLALLDGQISEALHKCDEAATMYHREGARRNELTIRAGGGHLLVLLGQLQEAASRLEPIITEAERLGLSTLAAFARMYHGVAKIRLGDIATGETELALLQGRVVEATLYQADLNRCRGEREAATESLMAVMDSVRDAPAVHAFAQAILSRSTVDRELALESSRTAVDIARTCGGLEGTVYIYVARGEALAGAGFHDEAREATAYALAEMKRVLGSLSEDALRASYIESVPENQEALALARKLGVDFELK